MPPEKPIFLVDRSLGRFVVPGRVRALRYQCLTLADMYDDEEEAQRAADTQWLDDAAPKKYVVLTRDGNLYVNDHERIAVTRGRFSLSRNRVLTCASECGGAGPSRRIPGHPRWTRHLTAPGTAACR